MVFGIKAAAYTSVTQAYQHLEYALPGNTNELQGLRQHYMKCTVTYSMNQKC